MRKLGFFVIFVSFFLFAGCASATTYYIDYASGSDANNGTSKTTPWMHVPGMHGCNGVCASTSPNPGDSFILRGGVTWPNAAFPILWSWSGSSGNSIYIGVDKTWYAGASWARPIFNASGTPIAGTYNEFIRALSQSYVTWDNLEMTGLNWQTSYSYSAMGCGVFAGGTNILISNWYVHGWSHTGGVTTDDLDCVLGDTNPPYMANSLITTSIFDGSDSTNGGDSGSFTYAWPSVTRSVIHDTSNALLVTGNGEIAYNNIYNVTKSFDTSVHENAIETLIANGTFYIHDNVIHDVYGETMMTGNNNETDYIWNNVLYNLTGANSFHFAQNNGQSITALYYFNNTIVPNAGASCFIEVFSPTIGTLTIENNHCITTGSLNSAITGVTPTISNNTLQTPTVASGLGFTSTETYAYSPTSATSSILTLGVNLSGNCSGILASLCSDTSYACTVDATKQVVCPSRRVVTRPSGSLAWNKGAYMAVSSATQPAPPLNVTAVAQ